MTWQYGFSMLQSVPVMIIGLLPEDEVSIHRTDCINDKYSMRMIGQDL